MPSVNNLLLNYISLTSSCCDFLINDTSPSLQPSLLPEESPNQSSPPYSKYQFPNAFGVLSVNYCSCRFSNSLPPAQSHPPHSALMQPYLKCARHLSISPTFGTHKAAPKPSPSSPSLLPNPLRSVKDDAKLRHFMRFA